MSYSPDRIKQLNDERLKDVCPIVAEKVRKVIELAAADGFTLLVTTGLRTYAEQTALYNQPHDGKDNDGDGRVDEKDEHVTNAKCGQSFHNFGLAVDLAFVINGSVSWNAVLYRNLPKWAVKVGLESGANWRTFTDLPHLQQVDGMSTATARALYAKGGLKAVWAKIGSSAEKPNTSTVPAGKSSTITTVFEELKKGATNVTAVKAMQKMLVLLGFLRDTDGVFGTQTDKAVRAFQGEYGLRQDGIFGKSTAEKLTEVFNEKGKK